MSFICISLHANSHGNLDLFRGVMAENVFLWKIRNFGCNGPHGSFAGSYALRVRVANRTNQGVDAVRRAPGVVGCFGVATVVLCLRMIRFSFFSQN